VETMDSLVSRLSEGEHAVEVTIRPKRTATALKECLDRGYVHIRFPNTRGGTELGVRVDKTETETGAADFTSGTGRIRIVGGLTLNYVKVKCIADVDLQTMEGKGHLVPIEANR